MSLISTVMSICPPLILRRRLHVLDVAVHAGDFGADRRRACPSCPPTCTFSLTVYAGRRVFTLVPLDLDAPFRVVLQVDDVGAGRGVDRHALAAADVADDLLPANRVAAAGAHDQQIVDAAHLDLVLARPPQAARPSTPGRFPPAARAAACSGGIILHGRSASPTACRSRTRRAGRPSCAGRAPPPPSAPPLSFSIFAVSSNRRGFLLEQALAQLDAARLLLRLDVVADLLPRPRRRRRSSSSRGWACGRSA